MIKYGPSEDAASGKTGSGIFASSGAAAAPLPVEFFNRPAERVARELLGALLVAGEGPLRCAAEIVETEAYAGPEDEASHAHIRFGVTPRNTVMFGAPGLAYIYLIYGIHWCLNAVTGEIGFPAAVLIRAARPMEGIELMRARRPGRPDRDLLRGPGNLTRALAMDGSLNGHPLSRAPLQLMPGSPVAEERIRCGPRIGISRAVDWPLRFRVADSPYVSR
ncbi:DNA-3-methyladenine glycosylase [soil metagenome]